VGRRSPRRPNPSFVRVARLRTGTAARRFNQRDGEFFVIRPLMAGQRDVRNRLTFLLTTVTRSWIRSHWDACGMYVQGALAENFSRRLRYMLPGDTLPVENSESVYTARPNVRVDCSSFVPVGPGLPIALAASID